MDISLALILTLFISCAISTVLMLMLSNPLRTMLESVCDGDQAATFWVVFTALMLYVVPLLVGLVFAVATMPNAGVAPASGMTRILASILAGDFVALAGIGMKLSGNVRNIASSTWSSRDSQRGDFR